MKIKRYFSIILYLLILVPLALTIIISLLYPKNNLIPKQMGLLVVVFGFFVVVFFYIWQYIYRKFCEKEPLVYFLFLLLMGILCFVVSLKQADKAVDSFLDYSCVYNAASSLAKGEANIDYSYFKNYSNNVAPMLLLSFFFKVAALLHIPQNAFVMAIVSIQIVLTAYSMGYLVEEKNNHMYRFPLSLSLCLFLPLWIFNFSFYTDTMSMGPAIIAMAILKKTISDYQTTKNIWHVWGGAGIAGIFLVYAVEWKVTSLIPVIAVALAYLLKNRKLNWKLLCALAVPFLIIYCIVTLMFANHEVMQMSKKTADPTISWVAIGLKGDGTWAANRAVTDYEHTLSSTEEKKEFVIQYIKENWREAFTGNHIKEKIRKNFADGNLSAADFVTISDDSVFWNLFNPWGKYYWRVSQYDFCYIMVVYIALLGGCFCNLVSLIKKQDIRSIEFGVHISFLGIFAFLMLWEANSRQLYNQMPFLIMGCVLFIEKTNNKVDYWIGKIKEKKHS